MSDVRRKRDDQRDVERPVQRPVQHDVQPATPARTVPDYELQETVEASSPAQLKALGDPLRNSIHHLLAERAATTTELAEVLGRPRGTVDHHLKVLQGAGLVGVVRTRRVRALTERFWGRTARTIFVDRVDVGPERDDHGFLSEAMVNFRNGEAGFTTLRYARIPEERVAEYARRLDALTMEFLDERRGGDTVFGLLVALAPTDRPALSDVPAERSDG